jgi:hypothetical protein
MECGPGVRLFETRQISDQLVELFVAQRVGVGGGHE